MFIHDFFYEQALLENNPLIMDATEGMLYDWTLTTLLLNVSFNQILILKVPSLDDGGSATQYSKSLDVMKNSTEGDEEWLQISQMQSRYFCFILYTITTTIRLSWLNLYHGFFPIKYI